MRKARPSGIERLESYLVKLIQEKGADLDQPPVTEIFARTLAAEGRKVAILSRGYRRKEAPWWVRMFTQVVSKPLVVSDGRHVLLDSATGGDEPYMLARRGGMRSSVSAATR